MAIVHSEETRSDGPVSETRPWKDNGCCCPSSQSADYRQVGKERWIWMTGRISGTMGSKVLPYGKRSGTGSHSAGTISQDQRDPQDSSHVHPPFGGHVHAQRRSSHRAGHLVIRRVSRAMALSSFDCDMSVCEAVEHKIHPGVVLRFSPVLNYPSRALS